MPPRRGVKRSQDDAALDSSVNPFTLAARKAKKDEATSSPARVEPATVEAPPVAMPSDQSEQQPEQEQPTTTRMTRSRKGATATLKTTPQTTEDTPASNIKGKAKAPAKAKTPASKAKDAEKTYRDTLKDIDKAWNALHKKYRPNPNGWSTGITSDDFAKVMEGKYLPTVRSLLSSQSSASAPGFDSPMLAFMLLQDVAEYSYGNLEACVKASGFGDTDEPFQRMDKFMVEIIARLRDEGQGTPPANEASEEPEPFKVRLFKEDVGTEWKELYDTMDKKRGPNKQQRGWLDKARVNDLTHLFQRRRERRDALLKQMEENGTAAGDWACDALNALAETRDRIDAYGIGKYFFAESIKLLAEIKGVEAPTPRFC